MDDRVVAGFGDEWTRFDQSKLTAQDIEKAWHTYFRLFPWHLLDGGSVGFDLGCGSGRWAQIVAPKVGVLHCIDASSAALGVAKRKLALAPNVTFTNASVDALPFRTGQFDFGYCLGVLHHVPDTAAGMTDAVKLLKRGAPFLVYLYYSFENRPLWFRYLWKGSELLRFVVSRLPMQARYWSSQFFAASLYWPLARAARLGERLGADVAAWPLSMYRHFSFYAMRTDALDRLGTRLEQRFSRDEVQSMMEGAGLCDIVFSDGPGYWVAHGTKR